MQPADLESLSNARSLFLSPHLDDIAFSAGGTVAKVADRSDAPVIVTAITCGGPPPYPPFARILHELWGGGDERQIWERRRKEDAEAAERLGAKAIWLGNLDALYRGYDTEEAVFGSVHADEPLIERLWSQVLEAWRRTPRAVVYAPLGIGLHVDHQICATMGARLAREGAEVWHYEDFPYVVQSPSGLAKRLRTLGPLTPRTEDVSLFMDRRLEATAAYVSQLRSVFHGLPPYRESIEGFAVERAKPIGARFAERFWGRSHGADRS